MDEPLSAESANARVIRRIVIVSILAFVDVVILVGTTVTSVAMLFKIKDHDSDDDDKTAINIAQAFGAPPLIAALIAAIACALTSHAERAPILNTKLKVRTAVGVLWAINIGISLIATVLWGIVYLQIFFYAPSFTLPRILFPVVMVCLLALFVYSIVLTAFCFATKYSLCCNAYPWKRQLTNYTTGSGTYYASSQTK